MLYTAELAKKGIGVNFATKKNMVSAIAIDLVQFSQDLNNLLIKYKFSWKRFERSLEGLVQVTVLRSEEERDGAVTLQIGLQSLQAVFRETLTQMNMFKDSILGLPKISKEISRARHSTTQAVDQLLQEFSASQRSIVKIGALIENLLNLQY